MPGIPWNGKPISTFDLDDAKGARRAATAHEDYVLRLFLFSGHCPSTDIDTVEPGLAIFIQSVVSIWYLSSLASRNSIVERTTGWLRLAFAGKGSTCPRVHE